MNDSSPEQDRSSGQRGWDVTQTGEGIIRVLVRDGYPVDVLMLEGVIARHKELAPAQRSPVLYYVNPRPPFDPEILGLLGRHDVRSHVSAVAGIVESAAMRTAASIFLGFVDPPFPVRLFESEESAVAWLNNFGGLKQE